MSVLTEIVIADLLDAQRVCDSPSPRREFRGMDAKGIDPVKLATLQAILSEGMDNDSGPDEPVCSGGDEGPWVMEMPSSLVQGLSNADPTRLNSVAVEWGATEELEDWPAPAVQAALTELAALCKCAAADGKAVLVWMSL